MGDRMLKRQSRKTIAAREAKVAPVRQRRPQRAVGCQVCLGVLIGWDEKGPLVAFDGSERGAVRARLAGSALMGRPEASLAGREVVLLLDSRPNHPPVLLGFLQPAGAETAAEPDLEAHIDGRRVELEGRDEIVLRCGEASITLRRNGRVVINGVQVETHASGLNRIRGGSVSIN